jgi:hypothetical protein
MAFNFDAFVVQASGAWEFGGSILHRTHQSCPRQELGHGYKSEARSLLFHNHTSHIEAMLLLSRWHTLHVALSMCNVCLGQ